MIAETFTVPGKLIQVLPAESDLGAVPVTYHVATGEWELLREYMVWCPVGECTISVPEGFRFDLASVPRQFWSIVAPFELSIVAPLVHDYLYRNGGWVLGSTYPRTAYSRKDADESFRELMRTEGVSRWRVWLAYLAVRWFGSHAWRG